VKTDDGLKILKSLWPKEMGGEGGKTHPDQLFAAEYAACLVVLLGAVAGKVSFRANDSEIKAIVHHLKFAPGSF